MKTEISFYLFAGFSEAEEREESFYGTNYCIDHRAGNRSFDCGLQYQDRSPGPCHGRGTSWRVSGTYGVGIHFLIPFLTGFAKKVNLKEQVEDFPPQPVITKDNVTMQIDTVVFFYITDPKMYAYGVERPLLPLRT